MYVDWYMFDSPQLIGRFLSGEKRCILLNMKLNG